jgi:hypothetical protein
VSGGAYDLVARPRRVDASNHIVLLRSVMMTKEDKRTTSTYRARWAAIGAAVAVSLGAGGFGIASATISSGERAVFVPITPCRVMDTRPAPETVGSRAAPLGAHDTHTITVVGASGNCNVPTEATGVVMNVTAVGPTQPSFLTVFPFGATRPLASNLNFVAGQAPTPNAVTVDVPATGQVSFYNHEGTVNVIADIVGYYADHNHDDRYYTKDELDAYADEVALTNMFAVVNVDGSLRRGTPGTSSSQFPGGFTGDYRVFFPRSVAECAWVASVSASADGNNPFDGQIGVTTLAGAGNANGLYVQGGNSTGAAAEIPFTVIVSCP